MIRTRLTHISNFPQQFHARFQTLWDFLVQSQSAVGIIVRSVILPRTRFMDFVTTRTAGVNPTCPGALTSEG